VNLCDLGDILHNRRDVVVEAVIEVVLYKPRELAGNGIRGEQNAGFEGFDSEAVIGSAVVLFERSRLVNFRRRRNRLRLWRAGKNFPDC
jgi:hypothetical protein